MKRLKDFSYNNKIWEVRRNAQNEFCIINKNTNNSYFIKGNVVAIEQVSDNNFIIIEKAYNSYIFLCYELEYNVVLKLYVREFSSIDFISDDLILFDKDLETTTVFSISNHIECKENIFFIVTRPAVESNPFCWSYHTELVFDNDANSEYPKYLFVTYKLLSFVKEEYIQVLVDVKTWKPIAPVYSTFRKNFIEIPKDKKLLEIFKEDNYKLKNLDKDRYYRKSSNTNLLKPIEDFIYLIK